MAREKKEDAVECRMGDGGAGRGRKRASVEMFGLEDSLSNMALDLGGGGGLTKITSFSAIRV